MVILNEVRDMNNKAKKIFPDHCEVFCMNKLDYYLPQHQETKMMLHHELPAIGH